MITLFASIPSPSVNVFEIGPITIHIYGILMGIAVATAYILTVSRYERFGGNRNLAERAAFWAVVIGFVGARLGYVATHTHRIAEEGWFFVVKIWEGGNVLFGGLVFGTLAVIWVLRRSGGSFPTFLDAVAVGLPAAQAIGRWGNYFNQELFGTPTDLPWGLEITKESQRIAAGYPDATTFHPTFLYEMLWNLGIVALLLWLEKRVSWRRGRLFSVYMMLYAVIRFLTELIRTDTSFRIFGVSRNGWLSVLLFLGGLAVFWWLRGPRPEGDAADEAADAVAAGRAAAGDGDGENGEASEDAEAEAASG